MRVAVIGASGFAGQAVTELLLERHVDVVPFVHSTGNSWGLSANGTLPRQVDLLDRPLLTETLSDCTHVINCSRGSDEVMSEGLHNLLLVSKKHKVQRFVHISSVAVYGDPPPPEAEQERAPTHPGKKSYGEMKLQQDEMVTKFGSRGLPAVIVCPPNIIGPGSPYLCQLLDALYRGTFLLADGGETVCNTVDVRNLASACWLALSCEAQSGRRYFVTDDERVTWKRVIDCLRATGEVRTLMKECTLDELRQITKIPTPPSPSFKRSLLHLISSDVRREVRKDPLLANVDSALRSVAAIVGAKFEDRVRLAIEGPPRVTVQSPWARMELRLSAQQLRGVWHRCDLAKSELGYRPIYSFEQSMVAFTRWLRQIRGVDDSTWDLSEALYVSAFPASQA